MFVVLECTDPNAHVANLCTKHKANIGHTSNGPHHLFCSSQHQIEVTQCQITAMQRQITTSRLMKTTNQWRCSGCCSRSPPVTRSPPPPLSFPTPCRSPGGGGGPSLGQPKNFRCGSLCCCVGDCVVGHCHLYPLHSWRDILLTFAEMELDSTTMFPLGTGQM